MKRLEFDTSPTTGRPVLLVSLIIVSLFITTLWYREGADGPLHATRRGLLTVGQPFAWFGTVVTSPFRAAGNLVSGATTDRSDYDVIKKQNLELKQRLAELEEAKLENERIRALVAFAKAQDYKTAGARVIGRPTDSWEGSIVIDRGSSAGVEPGDPVIASGGLVGQVIEVAPFSSKVRLVTAQDSGVSVLVQRSRANGIVRGSVDGSIRLEFVDKTKAPIRGDVLVTSGLGGVYPKGIVVGEVTDVASPQADLFPDVLVASRVAIDKIEEVLVLTGPTTVIDGGPGGGE
ncbi:MAG: rod shape-determining protein MreC [Coriobacteriia bacterium]|nr:rod shape-determining protein MreC [Coriobacteriia bacterium]